MDRKPAMRREPSQERGQRRLDALLDAAAGLIAEVGYEGATTNAIAARAGASIGSLYQFFPDKGAILRALADRYLTQLRAVHDAVLNDETAGLPLGELYDRVIGALADFHRTSPGFRPLFFGSPTSPELREACALLHSECIGRVEGMMARRYPRLDADHRRLAATINVETLKALLPLSESGDEAFRARVLAEIKSLLMAYTERVIG